MIYEPVLAEGGVIDVSPEVVSALKEIQAQGVLLIADGFDHHVPKGYVYFAMAFSVAVEMLNIRVRRRQATAPVQQHEPYTPAQPEGPAAAGQPAARATTARKAHDEDRV